MVLELGRISKSLASGCRYQTLEGSVMFEDGPNVKGLFGVETKGAAVLRLDVH